MPALIRWAKFPDYEDHIPEAEAESLIRKSLAQAALDYMQKHYKEGITDSFLLQNQKDIWHTNSICQSAILLLKCERNTSLFCIISGRYCDN